MSFLAGDSEMAKRIRDFDWSGHPLGPPDQWPLSLRAALGIALNSVFPTAIYWGPELRLLYNDAWSKIPGPRHPYCMGEPAETVWADIWHVLEPQFTQIIETGQGLFVDDQHLPMRRYGYEEETYWSYGFTPIRGDDGAIEGIFNFGQETTKKIHDQRRTAFLLEIMDDLRALSDPGEAMDVACRKLGEHLGAVRVGIRELRSTDALFPITSEWTKTGHEPAGNTEWTKLGPISSTLLQGRIVTIEQTSKLEDPNVLQVFEHLEAGSALAIPWLRSGELIAVLFVHRTEAGRWEDEQVSVAEQTFARVMHSVEQDRAAIREKAMMLEIDHRARNLLGVTQSLVRLTTAETVEAFRTSLLQRMGALGRTLGILSASKWVGAPLDALLKDEIAPFQSEEASNVTLKGPDVVVRSDMAHPIAMAVHELVTNAVKYGALSSNDGNLEVSWEMDKDQILRICWKERNKDLKKYNVDKDRGFGSRLLALTIENQLGGSLDRHSEDGSFECHLSIPFPASDPGDVAAS